MLFFILLVLAGIAGNLRLGTWLAGMLYKDSQHKAIVALAFSLLGMVATAAVIFAGCMCLPEHW